MKLSASVQKRLAAYGGNVEALLDVAENIQTHRANGRALGAAGSHKRAMECREKWRAKAAQTQRERPYLTLDQIAAEVFNWCRQNTIRMKNGRNYSLTTILRDLRTQKAFAPK